MAELPKLDVVIGNNFGHLPMFIGAEKGFFKKHGVDADEHRQMTEIITDHHVELGQFRHCLYSRFC